MCGHESVHSLVGRHLGGGKTMRTILRKTWKVCWGKIVKQGEILWRSVTGPIGTVIANLTRIGWACESPEVWVDQDSASWSVETNPSKASYAELSDAIRDACVRHLDLTASRHRGGGGIELGVDLTVTKKHLAKLSRDHNHAGRGLLQAAATGGLWLNARVHDSHPEVEATCHLCGAACQDEMHLLYGCDVVKASADPLIADTDNLLSLIPI